MDALDLSILVEGFRAEAAEHLHVLNAQLLALEENPHDLARVREMFLSAHTIKGSGSMLDLDHVSSLAHALEEVLVGLRDGRRVFDSRLADLLFRAVDALQDLVQCSQPGTAPPSGLAATVAELTVRLHAETASEDGCADVPRGMVSEHATESTSPVHEASHTQDPRVQNDAGDDTPASAEPRGAEPGPVPSPERPSPRVLMVEESATVRMLQSMLLDDAGFTVEAVGDGIEALAMARRRAYDLIVTGVETRGLGGLDLVRILRDEPDYLETPMIVMTSDENAEVRRRAAELGVQGYIRKGTFGQHRLVDVARALAVSHEP